MAWLRSRIERSSGLTTYAIEWREGGKVRARQLGPVTEKEAQYELAAMQAGKRTRRAATAVDAKRAVREYLKHLKVSGRRQGTVDHDQDKLKPLLDEWGDHAMAGWSRTMLEAMLHDRSWSPSRVRQALGVYRRFIAWCRAVGYVCGDFVGEFKPPRARPREHSEALSSEQCRRLLDEAKDHYLEVPVALALNMFYNTGIATYIWVLTNRKPVHRQGKVQLIDATQWFRPLRKNLGKKNCELSPEDIQKICDVFLAFEETEQSKIFSNEAFGYQKVTVDRPLRLRGIDADRAYTAKEIKALREEHEVTQDAPAVIRKIHKRGAEADPIRGMFPVAIKGKEVLVEYEPDKDLRDTEQVPLLEEGGIEAFVQREVLPHAPGAWYAPDSVKIGYEISFTRYFYKPTPMRSLEEIRADILALEKETEGLLSEITGRGS